MLESLHFKNFKSLREVELLGLGRLNVLVGPSGSGKTSVLEGAHLLSWTCTGHPDERRFQSRQIGAPFQSERAPGRLATLGSAGFELSETDSFGDRLRLTYGTAGCEVEKQRAGHEPVAVRPSESTINKDWVTRETSLEERFEELLKEPYFTQRRPHTLLRLNASALARVSATDSERPRLASDGAGLPSVLSHFANAHHEVMDLIAGDLRDVIGHTGRIRILPAQVTSQETEVLRIGDEAVTRHIERKVWGHRLELEIDGAGFVPADLLSEGTLILLGLLTALHDPASSPIVLIDDLDHALHPRAQRQLLLALRRLLERRPELQLIATTHSPYLVDALEAEEVQVMTLDEQHHSRVRRLDHHPDWPKYKGMLEAGEFWGAVGEDWVAEDRAGEAPWPDRGRQGQARGADVSPRAAALLGAGSQATARRLCAR